MSSYKEMVILIAEDDDGHAELVREGLAESGVCNKIIRFSNGEEIWQFLSGDEIQDGSKAAQVRDKNTNYLLLLDIRMPRMGGVEVLRRMKDRPELEEIPVMMLTTTDDPREVQQCYKLGCSVYITKPVDFAKFAETLRRLGLFIQVIKV